MPTRFPEVGDSSAVAYDEAVEAPFVTKYMLQQTRASATRLALKALIGAHDFLYTTLLYQVFECRQVGFPQIAWRKVLYIEVMACLFRSAMHGKVLGTSVELGIFAVCRTLQSSHDGKSHT